MKSADMFQVAWGDVPEAESRGVTIPGWLVENLLDSETFENGGLSGNPSVTEEPLSPLDIDRILEATGDQGELGSITKDPNHPLAVYLPYAFYGRRWGIYINETACLNEAARMYRNVSASKPNLNDCINAVNEFVLRHELGHFAVERAGAAVMLASGQPTYKASHSVRKGDEEPLCTLREMRDLGTSVVSSRPIAHDCRQYWESLPLPRPYDAWSKLKPDGQIGYENVSVHLWGSKGASPILRDLFRVERRKDVPIRRVPLTSKALGVLAGISPRIVPLSLQAMVDHARRCENAGDPPGVLVVKGNRHRYTVKRSGFRSVDLDTVKWERADYRVVKEMAELLGMTAAEYVEMVRSKKATTPRISSHEGVFR